jgi:hypothetical protein
VYFAVTTYIAVGQNKTCSRHASSGTLSDNRWSNERLNISKHLWPAPLFNIFPHYLINGTIGHRKVIEKEIAL